MQRFFTKKEEKHIKPEEEFEILEQKPEDTVLDLLKFKILCLMVCRGEVKYKAEKFFDLILRVKPGTTPTKT